MLNTLTVSKTDLQTQKRRTLSQPELVNAAIAAAPERADELANAFQRGWDFMPGQIGPDGLPKAGQLPRPTRGG